MSPKIRPIIIGISAVFIISIIFYIDSSTERIKYGDYPENQYPCVGNPDSYTCDWNIDHESAVPEDLFSSRSFSDNLTMVTLPSYEGDMSVLKNHISIISFLRPGIVKMYKKDGNIEEFFDTGKCKNNVN